MNIVKEKADDILAPIRAMYKHKVPTYKQGLIGAIGGVAVVCILHIIITMFIPRLYGVVSVLYPICGVYGYMLLHGKRDLTGKPVLIIFLTSLAGVLITGVLLNLFAPMISMRMGMGAAASRLGMNMSDIKFWLFTIFYAVIPMIFVCLGMATCIYKINVQPKKKSKKSHK